MLTLVIMSYMLEELKSPRDSAQSRSLISWSKASERGCKNIG